MKNRYIFPNALCWVLSLYNGYYNKKAGTCDNIQTFSSSMAWPSQLSYGFLVAMVTGLSVNCILLRKTRASWSQAYGDEDYQGHWWPVYLRHDDFMTNVFCITGPLSGESTGGFPTQRTSNAEHFYPAALKGSGVLSSPERAGGRVGGRADKPR